MKRVTTLIWLFTMVKATNAQQAQLDVPGTDQSGAFRTVRFYDPGAVGTKKAPVLDLGDIEGTPFWDEHWNPGFLVLRNGSTINLNEIKVNQFSHEVHYLNNEAEMSADGLQVTKVVLMKAKDTNQVLARFEAMADPDASGKVSFFRVANDGRFRLLDLQKATVKTSAYDPSLGKKENRWLTKSRYFLADNALVQPLGDLDKDKILALVKADATAEAWLKANKNKLKNEADVVAFLNYWNKK